MAVICDAILIDVFAVITALVAVVYAYFMWAYQYWKSRNIPYLEPNIPWGNFESPRKRTQYLGDSILSMYNKAKSKGWKYCGMYIMVSPHLVVLDLDLIKKIMTTDFHNFVGRGVYANEVDDPLSTHLFSLTGTKWKNLRAKLSPSFTSGKLKAMFSTLLDCGIVLEKYFEQHIDDEDGIDIKNVLGNFSTDIIGSCAFGVECNSFSDPNSPFRTYGKKVFNRSKWENLKDLIFMNEPLSKLLRLKVFSKDITDFFTKVIEDTINYRQKNKVTRNDFLQLLIDMKSDEEEEAIGDGGDKKTLTFNEIAAQSFLFFLAGFETTSSAMTFGLFLLAQHQGIQDKVREEIKRVLEKHDGKVTYDSLMEMKYLKQVIDESQRLYPALPFVVRISEEDYKIPGEDLVLEKGTRVVIPILGIHMDEEYYENPRVFNPDRFSEENKAARHEYAHLPFGKGPRGCIGKRFGIMQTKVGLTTILKNFRVTLNKKTKLPLELSTLAFIPAAKYGVWLDLKKL